MGGFDGKIELAVRFDALIPSIGEAAAVPI